MTQLAGRVAIVTGAGRGIGRAIALAYAREGAAVALVDRDEGVHEAADACAAEGARSCAVVADVADAEAVAEAVRRTLEELGGLHILVNNAGLGTWGPVTELPVHEWQRLLAVNLGGVFLFTAAVLPTMTRQRFGRIINIGSQLAMRGGEQMAHYSATKGGVHAFTRAVAREVAEHGITANVIAPGPIATEMTADDPVEVVEEMVARIPLKRLGRPEEIAPTAVLLASDAGAYYTGSTLNVSGGDVM